MIFVVIWRKDIIEATDQWNILFQSLYLFNILEFLLQACRFSCSGRSCIQRTWRIIIWLSLIYSILNSPSYINISIHLMFHYYLYCTLSPNHEQSHHYITCSFEYKKYLHHTLCKTSQAFKFEMYFHHLQMFSSACESEEKSNVNG